MATTLEREHELDSTAAALDDAADGRGSLLVIEGPAGIGKTRLVADARALAKLRGFGRLWAVGDEHETRSGPMHRRCCSSPTSRGASRTCRSSWSSARGRQASAAGRSPS